eukprot:3525742-Pyramimonas_sp.AAC.1
MVAELLAFGQLGVIMDSTPLLLEDRALKLSNMTMERSPVAPAHKINIKKTAEHRISTQKLTAKLPTLCSCSAKETEAQSYLRVITVGSDIDNP